MALDTKGNTPYSAREKHLDAYSISGTRPFNSQWGVSPSGANTKLERKKQVACTQVLAQRRRFAHTASKRETYLEALFFMLKIRKPTATVIPMKDTDTKMMNKDFLILCRL